jgi:hypothetical protein
MSSSRILIFRIVCATLVVVILLILAAVGLVWVAWYRQEWVETVLSTPDAEKLAMASLSAQLALPSADSDGDSIPDWLELQSRTDPRAASSHMPLIASMVADGGVYSGQRTRVRWGWFLRALKINVRWPAGFRAIVRADAPILLAPGSAAPPSAGPLPLTASLDGYLDFDVLVSQPGTAVHLFFSHPNPQVVFDEFPTGCRVTTYGWRQPAYPPLPVKIEGRVRIYAFQAPPDPTPPEPPDGVTYAPSPEPSAPPLEPHLIWQPLPVPGLRYIVEASRADRPDDWIAVDEAMESPLGVTPIYGSYERSFPRYQGPLRYRIVPTTPTPPEPGLH